MAVSRLIPSPSIPIVIVRPFCHNCASTGATSIVLWTRSRSQLIPTTPPEESGNYEDLAAQVHDRCSVRASPSQARQKDRSAIVPAAGATHYGWRLCSGPNNAAGMPNAMPPSTLTKRMRRRLWLRHYAKRMAAACPVRRWWTVRACERVLRVDGRRRVTPSPLPLPHRSRHSDRRACACLCACACAHPCPARPPARPPARSAIFNLTSSLLCMVPC